MRTWRKTSLRLRWVNRRTGCCRLPHKVDGRGVGFSMHESEPEDVGGQPVNRG
jgi:hypothetical protein